MLPAKAIVHYTDIDPDSSYVQNGEIFNLDLNNDSIIDFEFSLNILGTTTNIYNNIRVNAFNNNGVEAYYSSAFQINVLDTLSYGEAINDSQNFVTGGPHFAAVYFQAMSLVKGDLLGQTGYVGLRLEIGGKDHFGWLRLSIAAQGETMTFHDHAWESRPDIPIPAGYIPVFADTVSNLLAVDAGDQGNSTDLQVSFDKAADESTVSEYRAYVVKSPDAAAFNIDSTFGLPSTSYTVIPKTGQNIVTAMDTQSRDIDGFLLVGGQPYHVFIMAVADGVQANTSSLSGPSNEVTLTIDSSPATAVQAADADDWGNGQDLEITFTKALDEAKITEYRALIVRTTDTAGFDLTTANSVAPGNYVGIAKTGQDINIRAGALSRDISGVKVTHGISYTIYIMSVADGIFATDNVLSLPSLPVTLQTLAPKITDIEVNDVSDHGNGLDLDIAFDKADNEDKVDSYRIYVLKAADAPGFSVNIADTIPPDRYKEIPADGNDIFTTLDPDAVDIDGDPVREHVPYVVFAVTRADPVNATLHTLSVPSDEITLEKNIFAGSELVRKHLTTPEFWINQGVLYGPPDGDLQLSVYRLNGQLHYRQASLRLPFDLRQIRPEQGLCIVEVRSGNGASYHFLSHSFH